MFKETINALIDKSAEAIHFEDGDYYDENGLLMCGKCNTYKQTEVELFGEIKRPHCLCECEAEKERLEKAARENEEKEREYLRYKSYYANDNFDLLNWLNRSNYTTSEKLIQERINILRNMCFTDGESEMRNFTFENADSANAEIMNVARNYVEHFDMFKQEGTGLLFYGDVGVGKSYAAACIANALIDKGVTVLMTNFATIANTAQGKFDGKQQYFDSLNSYQLLILDDLMAERRTEYMQEIVHNVIDSRKNAGLPLIITTNLTAQELKNPPDLAYKRTFSRLLGMCHPYEAKGIDRRRERLNSNFERNKRLLGL